MTWRCRSACARTAATTSGCVWPTFATPMPASRSRYARPPASHTVAPAARATSMPRGAGDVWHTWRRKRAARSWLTARPRAGARRPLRLGGHEPGRGPCVDARRPGWEPRADAVERRGEALGEAACVVRDVDGVRREAAALVVEGRVERDRVDVARADTPHQRDAPARAVRDER